MRGLIAILLVYGTSSFGGDESLSSKLVRTEISIRSGMRLEDGPVDVVVDAVFSNSSRKLDKGLIEQVAVQLMQREQVRAQKFAGNLRSQLDLGQLQVSSLRPMLLVEVDVSGKNQEVLDVGIRLSLIEFRPNGSSTVFHPVVVWERNQTTNGIAGALVEKTVIEYIQGHRWGLIGALKRRKPVLAEANTKKLNESRSQGKVDYSVSWSDPNGKRDKLFMGVSIGAPALVNLNLGYWGGKGVPILVEVSGFYLDESRRGIQGQLGWIFDNTGRVKQGVSAVVAAVAENWTSRSNQFDVFGRAVSSTVTTTKGLNAYLGPSYFLDWHDFRVQVGVGAGISPNSQSSFRALFQLSYTIPMVGL